MPDPVATAYVRILPDWTEFRQAMAGATPRAILGPGVVAGETVLAAQGQVIALQAELAGGVAVAGALRKQTGLQAAWAKARPYTRLIPGVNIAMGMAMRTGALLGPVGVAASGAALLGRLGSRATEKNIALVEAALSRMNQPSELAAERKLTELTDQELALAVAGPGSPAYKQSVEAEKTRREWMRGPGHIEMRKRMVGAGVAAKEVTGAVKWGAHGAWELTGRGLKALEGGTTFENALYPEEAWEKMRANQPVRTEAIPRGPGIEPRNLHGELVRTDEFRAGVWELLQAIHDSGGLK